MIDPGILRDLFDRAVSLPPADRASFLDSACGQDAVLRREIERLLAVDTRGQSLFATTPTPGSDLASGPDTPSAPGLPAGTRLGPYEIIAPLGAGGMGEVYSARDTRLHRTVALKVLLAPISSDPQARQRFEREARAVAALSHPHICPLFDVGREGDRDFLVMEYLQGETLAARLRRGRLRLPDALRVADQIASALIAAHRAGIVHRDLKPGNVMLTESGVRLLDFGLACGTEASAAGATTASRPEPLTGTGMILGTLPYMAPEQIEGRPADPRTDIFAFGVVLYEMLTGRRAFEGASQAALIGSILRDDPPSLATVDPALPPALDRLVRRCVEKEPAARWPTITDVQARLEALRETAHDTTPEPDPNRMSASRPGNESVTRNAHGPAASHQEGTAFRNPTGKGITIAGIAAAMVIVVVTLVYLRQSRTVEDHTGAAPRTEHVRVSPLTSYPGLETNPSFSPDGNMIAFAWNGGSSSNTFDLYVKQVDSENALQLTHHLASRIQPAWSPDGRYVAFSRVADDERGIYVISPLGGAERKLGQRTLGSDLNWSPDGKWLVYSDAANELADTQASWGRQVFQKIFLLNFETLETRALAAPAGCFRASSPAFSPNGAFVAFACYVYLAPPEQTGSGVVVGYRIYVEPAQGGGGAREVLTIRGSDIRGLAWTVDGRSIVYNREGRLFSISVEGGVPRDVPFGEDAASSPTISRNQRLAYARESSSPSVWRLELASAGNPAHPPARIIASTRGQSWPSLSPDGKHIVFLSFRSGSEQLWLCDSDGSNPIQLTTEGARWGGNWSPDSRAVLFWSPASGLWTLNIQGGASKRLPTLPLSGAWKAAWSHDGKWLYLGTSVPQSIWKMPAEGGTPVQVMSPESYWIKESEDGTRIFFARGGRPGLRSASSSGGDEQVLGATGAWDPSRLFLGALARNGVYFEQPVSGDLSYLDFGDHRVHTVLSRRQLGLGLAKVGMSVSSDGRVLLYTQVDERSGDIVMIEGAP